MNRFFEHIISLLINIPTLFYYWFIHTDIHKIQTKDFCPIVKLATYKEFKKEIQLRNSAINNSMLHINNNIGFAYKEKNGNTQFWASIVSFDGVGYILTSYGWFMANIYMNRKFFKNYKKYIAK